MKKQPVYGMFNLREERELARASFEYIDRDIIDVRTNFIRLGFHLAECKNMKYYEDFGFENFYEFVEKNWGKDKTATSRHINIFMKFSAVSEEHSNNHKMWLDEKYEDYSYSQLSEMLQMNKEQMKQITPDMTVKEIRELKKSWKEKDKSCDVATKCSYDNNYVCNIEEITRKHFMKRGNIVGCAGCCFGCLNKEKCEYCCEFAKKEIELCKQKKSEIVGEVAYEKCAAYIFNHSCEGCFYDKEEKKCPYDKSTYIQKKQKIVAEVEYKEVQENIQTPEFPVLKNMEEREKFILSFKDWNVWCQNELTEETYYRYDLPDGAAIVVRSYPVYLEWKKEELEGKDLFLLKPGYKHFKNCETNMTVIKNYLKDLQKDKK